MSWPPRSINSSGTWSVEDLQAENARRFSGETPSPIGDDVHPVICSRGEGSLDLFATGKNKELYHKYWPASPEGHWSQWESWGGQLLGPPTAIASVVEPGRIDVFGTGLDGNLWQIVWDRNGLSSWFPQGDMP